MTNTIGTPLTKISFNNNYVGIDMVQTMYVIEAGTRNYLVTVTEVNADSVLLDTVFNTLCESK